MTDNTHPRPLSVTPEAAAENRTPAERLASDIILAFQAGDGFMDLAHIAEHALEQAGNANRRKLAAFGELVEAATRYEKAISDIERGNGTGPELMAAADSCLSRFRSALTAARKAEEESK